MCLAVHTIQGWPDEKKEREKENAKDDPKGPDEQTQDTEWRQFGGPNESKARRGCQDAMMASIKAVFDLANQTKVQARTITKTKAEETIKKEKAKKEPILSPDSQPQKHQMKRNMARPGNRTTGLPVIGRTIPGFQMLGDSAQGLMLHGW